MGFLGNIFGGGGGAAAGGGGSGGNGFLSKCGGAKGMAFGGALSALFELPSLIKSKENGDFGEQAGRSGVRIAGGVIGGAIGTCVGGPIGAIVGGFIGDWIGGKVGECIFGKSKEDTKQWLIKNGYDPNEFEIGKGGKITRKPSLEVLAKNPFTPAMPQPPLFPSAYHFNPYAYGWGGAAGGAVMAGMGR